MEDDAAADESTPTSPTRPVRARAASPPAAERKEKEDVDISKHVAMIRARSREHDWKVLCRSSGSCKLAACSSR